ncbi:SNF2-related protein [Nannocystis sp. RBIL2]|uniref:SNF2-related protein n=1 Tax=Nannocystis sp. RBIL2 TaxID=2996788 RepID=UPI00226E4C05|nr:SNF2-related protein [Nannocystis sp. RBIL2]MCY1065620.1 SNF2-related protein [Nannocystis sp. RBIL2]
MTAHAADFLDKLLPVWRRMLPPNVSPRYFDGFVRRNRSALEAMLGEWLERRAQKKAAASSHELPPDLWTRSQRTRANLEAMRVVANRSPTEMTADERRAVLAYSGWGGLSIKDNHDKFPKDLVPETFGLIHEYYTPTVVAEAIAEVVCPLLAQLAGNDGTVRALEPSAGIGRLVRAMGPPRCIFPTAEVKRVQWTTVEFSQVSSRMLEATYPAATHFHMPFERWIRLHGARHTGTINLILSNPPYGDRGEFALEDTDAFYREKTAYTYFMRRALDLLVPGGLGVFLVPAGFLSGVSNRAIREKLLRRHHLAGAYRLPSHTKDRREFVPGANVVMDILFWRSRGGELAEVDTDDQFILDGNYFVEFPQHLLGVEQGSFSGDDEAGTATSWRYQVIGDFAGLPQVTERPLCTACVLGPIVRREAPQYQALARAEEGLPDDIGEDVRGALLLGRRVGRYLAALGADEAERAAQLWPELHAALESFTGSFGNPWRHKLLRELADKRELVAAQQILGAFTKTGEIVAALKAPPEIERKYTGRPDDVIAQAEQLFRQHRALSVGKLEAFHKQVGGELGRVEIVDALLSAEWNLEGDGWDQLLPKDAYLTGNQLWDRYDRAAARAVRGDEQAKIQARRLLDAIKPAVFEDIQDINPQNVYDDLELLAGWLSATLNSKYGPVRLERQGGFVQAVGVDYVDSKNTVGLSPDTLAFLGYYNHDPSLFQPPREKRDRNDPPPSKEERQENKKRLAERRMELANQWAKSFRDWLAADDARKDRFVHAYNRATRGRIVPTFTPEPLEIARWGAQAPKLKAHQITGARRVLAARGGLVAFDVGVGKTYTALAIIARARQEGWVRRPVILVPGSLVWKWHDDILCTLPDYRVAVIGSKRKRISRGRRKDVLTSETDTPQERAAKWIALQSGQVDVVILSFDALARTRMNENAVLDYISKVESVERAIGLRKRNLEEKAESRKGRDKMSERERALLEHGVRAWVREILTLPEGYEYDPGVAWDELGIDMLVIDEAAAFKNLHMPQAREDGVPKFMGGGGEGSDRAWQVDFRAAAVRKSTGGAGIVLLTATPAKNSPLEFYNLIQFIDPTAFTSAGIHDPEQFIDRFLRIEYREVLDSAFDVTMKPAVTGFKNLDDLRTIIFTYGEFRTAAEVNLELPKAVVETLTIAMDEEQERRYRKYVAQIEHILENPSPDGPSNIILGLLARLSLVALHASLEDGYSYATALEGGIVRKKVTNADGSVELVELRLPKPAYESPKLVECAKRVAASAHCGHIIFCEPTTVHLWMREVLVSHGVPRERIAILNAEETAPADRIRIAREFNGLASEAPAPGTCTRPTDSKTAPKYDVIIANSVAYEGVDLQVRTCTIHHLDLPWTPADLEQRNGRAVRQGNTLGTVQIFYYFADGSTDGYRFSLIDGKATWLADLIKTQARDTNNPAAQQQLTPEDILLMISRDKAKTKKLLEDKKTRQITEARAKIAKESARLLRQAAGRFADARRSTDPERAAKLREEGEQRLADLERMDPEAWPWAPWMYAVRDKDVLIPENGGAPVYEGLRIVKPRAGHTDQFEHLEFGRVTSDEHGDTIGLRAAGSPSWQVIAYKDGLLGGAPLQPEHFPREGSPAWPADDDVTTGEAIEKKIESSLRYGKFENLGWRGAADAWLDRWWPRFADTIADKMAGAYAREKAPIVLDGKLVLATGEALREGSLLPPTRAGWQRFLELAPSSGENFTVLKDIGLAWWGRKVPQDLLSKERNLLRQLIVPRLLDDAGYRNARENSDEQNARIEHDRALGRVMLALFSEDHEAHGQLYRRYADDESFRRSLSEQAFAATYSTSDKPRQGAGEAAGASGLLSSEKLERLQILLAADHDDDSEDDPEPPEDVDQRVVDNLFLQRAAMNDALVMGRASKADRQKQMAQAEQTVERITLLRAEASILRRRGYRVVLEGGTEQTFNIIARDRKVLAARGGKVFFAPELDAEAKARIERDLGNVGQAVQAIMREERKAGSPLDDKTILSIWRRARAIGVESSDQTPAPQPPEPEETPPRADAATTARSSPRSDPDQVHEEARTAIRALGLPVTQHVKYLRQVDEAIASGKSYQPIVERARKAVEKLKGPNGKAGGRSAIRQPARPRQPGIDVVLDAFNAEPRWRLSPLRGRPNGYVLAVYPEGAGPDDAVAAIDVLDLNVDEVRWLDDRLASAEQDTILERVERALWAAYAAEQDDEGDDKDDDKPAPPPSPLQDLIALMERRTMALGARPETSKSLGRTDGYQEIARALHELAGPSGLSAEELQNWLESQDLMEAGEVVARSRVEAIPVQRLMQELWDSLLDAFKVVEVDEVDGVLRVPDEAIFDISNHETILERVQEGDVYSLRRHRLKDAVRQLPDEQGRVTVWDVKGDLLPGVLVHLRGRSERALEEVYKRVRAFHRNLVHAPKTLQDVRVLLYWTAAMLDAPLCQGDVKSRASSAFEQAKAYYDTARRRLMEGRTVDAVRRMHEALRRISAAAAEIARSCGEGQIDITVTSPHLPVSSEDRAAIEGGEVEVRP